MILTLSIHRSRLYLYYLPRLGEKYLKYSELVCCRFLKTDEYVEPVEAVCSTRVLWAAVFVERTNDVWLARETGNWCLGRASNWSWMTVSSIIVNQFIKWTVHSILILCTQQTQNNEETDVETHVRRYL